MDTVRNRKKMISPALFRGTFSKGLSNIGVPREWVKNAKMRELFEVENKENISVRKKRRTKTDPSYPLKNTSQNTPATTKWLSSTSNARR